jgi:putative toxin-antitoxin system antitoxin component (TIGR02293 family)
MHSLIRITALADTVFANHNKAWLWLNSPEPQLQNKTPISLLATEESAKQVEALLWGLDEGVFS